MIFFGMLFWSLTLFSQIGALQLQYQWELDSLAAQYPSGITTISGELIIGPHRTPGQNPNYDITDLSALRHVKRIGALIVDGNPLLTSLNALDSVYEIAAYLTISNNPKLEDVDFLKDVGGRPYRWLTIRDNPLIERILLDSFVGCGRYANIQIVNMPLLDTLAMPKAQGVDYLTYDNIGIKHLDSTSLPFTGDEMILRNMHNLESITLRRHGVDTLADGLDQVNWGRIELLGAPNLEKVNKSEFWAHGSVKMTGVHSLPTLDSFFQSAFYYRGLVPRLNGTSPSYVFEDCLSLDSAYIGYPNLPGEHIGLSIRRSSNLRTLVIDSASEATHINLENCEALTSLENLERRKGRMFLRLQNIGLTELPAFQSIDTSLFLSLYDNENLTQNANFLNPNLNLLSLEIERNFKLSSLPIFTSDTFNNLTILSIINNPKLSNNPAAPSNDSLVSVKLGHFSQLNKQRWPADSTEDFSRYFPATPTVIPVPKQLRYVESRFELGIGGNVILPAFDSLRYFRNAPLTRTNGDPLELWVHEDYTIQLPEGTPFPLLDTVAEVKFFGYTGRNNNAPTPYPLIPDLTFPSLSYHDWISYFRFSSPNSLPQPFVHEVPTSYALNTAGDTIFIRGLQYIDLRDLDSVPRGLDSTLRNQGLFLGSMSNMTNCDILCEYIQADLFKIELLGLNDNPTPECSDVMLLLQHCQVVDTENPTATHSFHIGPNPTSDYVTMYLEEPLQTSSIAFLVNAQGRIVHQQQVSAGSTQARIELGHLPNGPYALAIKGVQGAVLLLKNGAE